MAAGTCGLGPDQVPFLEKSFVAFSGFDTMEENSVFFSDMWAPRDTWRSRKLNGLARRSHVVYCYFVTAPDKFELPTRYGFVIWWNILVSTSEIPHGPMGLLYGAKGGFSIEESSRIIPASGCVALHTRVASSMRLEFLEGEKRETRAKMVRDMRIFVTWSGKRNSYKNGAQEILELGHLPRSRNTPKSKVIVFPLFCGENGILWDWKVARSIGARLLRNETKRACERVGQDFEGKKLIWGAKSR